MGEDVAKTNSLLTEGSFIRFSCDAAKGTYHACAVSIALALNRHPSCTCTIPYADKSTNKDDTIYNKWTYLDDLIGAVNDNRKKGELVRAAVTISSGLGVGFVFHGFITALNVIYANESRASRQLQVTLGSLATGLNTSLLNDTVVVSSPKLVDVPNPQKAKEVCAAIANNKIGTLFNQDDAFSADAVCHCITTKLGLKADTDMLRRFDVFMAAAVEIVSTGVAQLTEKQLDTVSKSRIISKCIKCSLKLNPEVTGNFSGGAADLSLNMNKGLLCSFIRGLLKGGSIWGTFLETITSYDYMLCFSPCMDSHRYAGKIVNSTPDIKDKDDVHWLFPYSFADIVSSYDAADSINLPDTFICSFSRLTAYLSGEENDRKIGDLMGIYTRNAELKAYIDNGGACKLPEDAKYRVRIVRAPEWLELSMAAALNKPGVVDGGKPTNAKAPRTDAEREALVQAQNRERQDRIRAQKDFMNKVAETVYNDQYGTNDTAAVQLVFNDVAMADFLGEDNYISSYVMISSHGLNYIFGRVVGVSLTMNNGVRSAVALKITLDRVQVLSGDDTDKAVDALMNRFLLFKE